jgi:lambda family phage portal protein
VVNWWETPLGKARLQEIARTAQPVAPPRKNRQISGTFRRSYASARNPIYSAGFPAAETSADAELVASIAVMRSRSRALIRDNSYAKRAKVLIQNNVIGTGIGMQAQVKTTRGDLNGAINDAIESTWCEWSEGENCHTGGRLSFKMFERALMAQVFEAGEVFVRKWRRPFGRMGLPLSLELIEAERLADDLSIGGIKVQPGNHFRLGVECDAFYRPVAYYFRKRHKGELRFSDYSPDAVERVPAEDIIHLAVIDRWPQTRGEPWMHTAILRLQDMDGYSEAEMTRARSQAVRMGIIESADSTESMADEDLVDGETPVLNMDPATIQRLQPGEKWIDSAPNAPNPQLDPFMRYMIREIAAGIGTSYESLSRDYSQSNYSSSRLALLDDRDLWRFYQSWFISDFRCQIHREWLQQAVLSELVPIDIGQYAIDPSKFEAVLFKPRGWTWIDPTKEVAAYKEAIRAGLTTRTDVISATGGGQDIEDVDTTRALELEDAAAKGLEFDTDPKYYMAMAYKEMAQASNNDAQANNNNAQADATEAGDSPPSTPAKNSDNAPPKAGRFILGVAK